MAPNHERHVLGCWDQLLESIHANEILSDRRESVVHVRCSSEEDQDGGHDGDAHDGGGDVRDGDDDDEDSIQYRSKATTTSIEGD